MRLLGRIILGIVTVVVLLSAGAYLLPRYVIIERSISIDAEAREIFPIVNSLRRGEDWSPWLRTDPDTELTYGGPGEGVGATMEWASETIGSGRQEITLSTPDERVETALDFGAQGPATAWFELTPDNSGTRLTWGLTADMGNSPVGRWMGLMMDDWVGADYERGLANIKALAEN